MGSLDSKVALVTGGASGIGEATVEAFIRAGARGNCSLICRRIVFRPSWRPTGRTACLRR